MGLAGVTVVVMVVALGRGWLASRSGAADPPVPAPPAASVLTPAANLRIPVAVGGGDGQAFLDPDAAAWKDAPPTAILLSRTPRIYATEPVRERVVPSFEVRAVRAGGKLHLRLEWEDSTRNAPAAPPAKEGGDGGGAQLYKRPTAETSTFGDAAAVMVPEQWAGPGFPSLSMGDKATPVQIYYWNASRGAAELKATGRATPQPSGASFLSQARHTGRKWLLSAELPDRPDGYPVAFAVWDGEQGDRDGLKFFSVWYVLARRGP
jgi:hypothetical protein